MSFSCTRSIIEKLQFTVLQVVTHIPVSKAGPNKLITNRSGAIKLFKTNSCLAMPKKRQQKTKQTTSNTSIRDDSRLPNEPVELDKNSNIVVKIIAKPGAISNSITGISSEGVGVQIAAPPVDGEANSELIRYISKLLGLRKSDVSLDKGAKSRNKTLIITAGVTSVEQILTKLKDDIS